MLILYLLQHQNGHKLGKKHWLLIISFLYGFCVQCCLKHLLSLMCGGLCPCLHQSWFVLNLKNTGKSSITATQTLFFHCRQNGGVDDAVTPVSATSGWSKGFSSLFGFPAVLTYHRLHSHGRSKLSSSIHPLWFINKLLNIIISMALLLLDQDFRLVGTVSSSPW